MNLIFCRFVGKAHLTYLSDKRVLGLSKIARGEYVCLTASDSGTFDWPDRGCNSGEIAVQGVGVIIEARHLGMQMCGVEQGNKSAGGP